MQPLIQRARTELKLFSTFQKVVDDKMQSTEQLKQEVMLVQQAVRWNIK
jgi:hypothetical protein